MLRNRNNEDELDTYRLDDANGPISKIATLELGFEKWMSYSCPSNQSRDSAIEQMSLVAAILI